MALCLSEKVKFKLSPKEKNSRNESAVETDALLKTMFSLVSSCTKLHLWRMVATTPRRWPFSLLTLFFSLPPSFPSLPVDMMKTWRCGGLSILNPGPRDYIGLVSVPSGVQARLVNGKKRMSAFRKIWKDFLDFSRYVGTFFDVEW
ncbi:hypothetical protein F2Q70_00027137 [Brassica cretica]|uniref:Uncharacterized protein n=1 Tax=Brassica cretica TaxID=69181 RepID=A0A8S9LFM8_BRACR|nr:hypothetical protein F2Q70_00027137 [Brassica cretica]